MRIRPQDCELQSCWNVFPSHNMRLAPLNSNLFCDQVSLHSTLRSFPHRNSRSGDVESPQGLVRYRCERGHGVHRARVIRSSEHASPVGSGFASSGSETSWWRALKDPPTKAARTRVGGSFRARHHLVTKSPVCSVSLNQPDTYDSEFTRWERSPNPETVRPRASSRWGILRRERRGGW